MIDAFKKIINLISLKEKKTFYLLIILMLFGSALEAVGLGLIIPLISIILDFENNLIQSYLQNFLNNFLLSLEPNIRIIYFSLAIGIFYLLKNIYIGYLYYRINTFAFSTRSELGNRLFKIYISKPYKFFTNQNSSKLINNIHNETNVFCEAALLPILVTITEFLLILAVSLILFFYDPFITIIVFLFVLIFSYIFQFLTKPLNSKWGIERQKSDEDRLKILTQGFGGIRELKIFNKLGFFKEKFFLKNFILGKVSGYQSTIQNFPKLYLELVAITSFLIIIIYKIILNNNIDNLITLLSLFGLAAFRMLPSANKIIHAQQSLRFSKPSIDRINIEMKDIKNMISNTENTEELKWKSIEFNNLSFSYDEKQNVIFTNLNLKIINSQKIGILGETGIGKSTLFDLLCGLIEPTKGKVTIDNLDILKIKDNSYLNKFGYVSQNIFLFDDTIKNNICFKLESEDNSLDQKLEKVLKVSELNDFISTLDDKVDTLVGEKGVRLSGGQKQRIGIARALYKDSEILILDEATNALDKATEKKIMNNIFETYSDKTIILISHDTNNLVDCDNIYEIKNSKIRKIK